MVQWSFVLGGVLAAILILAGFVAFSIGWDPFKEVIGLGDPLIEQDAVAQAQSALKNFVSEYHACKSSASIDCLCPFSSFRVPQGMFFELTNAPAAKATSIKLFKGEATGVNAVTYGEKVSEDTIADDKIFVPSKVPDRSVSYLNDRGLFDLASYRQETKLVVVGVKSPSKSETPMRVLSSLDFNFRGLYKVDDERMALVASPAAVFDVKLPVVGSLSEKELAKLQGLKRCVLVPDAVLQVAVTIKTKLQECVALGKPPPYACAPFSLHIPEKYVARFAKETLTVNDASQAAEKVLARVQVPAGVCNSPVYQDADLARFVPDGRELAFTAKDKFAAVVVLPKGQVCLHAFSEQEVLEGKVEALRRAKQSALSA